MSSEPLADAISTSTAPDEVRAYERQKLIAALVGLALNLLVLVFLTLAGSPLLDAELRRWVGDTPWLRLLLLGGALAVCLELVSLPMDFWSSHILEHRYGLSNESLAGWIWRRLKTHAVAIPIGLLVLCGGYGFIWLCGHWWWVFATGGWLSLTLVLGQLLPVLVLPLFFRVTRLDDGPLLERLRRLAEGTGLRVEGIYRLGLSAMTRKANAALAGLGRTRRVLLGDTLLDEFTPEEIEVVFAHEVGHHVHRHMLKMIALQVVLAALGLFLVDRVLVLLAGALHYRGTATLEAWKDPSALPLVLLVLAVFALLVMPLQNALSRAFERQSDRYALERTGLVEPYRTAFRKLAVLNKIDPNPPALAVWLLEDHPPLAERLAVAESYVSRLS